MFKRRAINPANIDGGNVDKDKEYRKILKELGFDKSENEPLTNIELRQIFFRLQEDLFVGE